MNRLLWGILIVVLLVAVVTGCGGAHRYDTRLVAADSLMQSAPDSALALVEALPPDSLTDEGDRAYRDLLLTQARYRNYIVATSDSDINRALGYYRSHAREREKLTRAFIYKGAVMDELGHPDSAMFYYKHAEATADEKDYYNLGYVKLRIAELYQYMILQDSAAILRLQEAKRCFSLLHDTLHVISALGKLGSICGYTHPDSAIHYLKEAIELSQHFRPSLQYSHKSTLAGCYFAQEDFQRAKDLSMDVLNNGKDECNETQFYYYAALSYIKLGLMDSAINVLEQTPRPIDEVDSMNYFNVLAEIANIRNRHADYKAYKELSTSITERIMDDSKNNRLAATEVQCDKLESESRYRHQLHYAIIIIIIAAITVLACVAALWYHRRKLRQQIQAINTELENSVARLQKETHENVSAFVSQRLDALNEIYQNVRIRINDENRVKKVIPLNGFLQLLNDKNEIINFQPSDVFWERMKSSVNGEYNNILTWVENRYPNLNERDMKLFCLLCAKLSPQIIRICMNLTSSRTVTNNRSLIIKKKMGLNMSFDTFVEKYMNNEFSCPK